MQSTAAKQEQRAVELNGRIGWRISEWNRLTGTSRATTWRQVKAGQLKVIHIGQIPLIPRSEAVRLGLIAE